MPIVVVYTDKGEQVWQSPATAYSLRSARCPTNTIGSSLVAGLRLAVEDAEAIEDGVNPERPSERAMRTSEGSRVAGYTKRHMENLQEKGHTAEPFKLGDPKAEARARSRIRNAADRLGIRVHTNVRWVDGGPCVVGQARLTLGKETA